MPSADNIADMFTKALHKVTFERHRAALGLIDLSPTVSPSSGGGTAE